MARSLRLEGKVAVVVGGGQTPGDTIGNGRATAILFAREGAHVVVVDRDLARARDTESAIRAEGGRASAVEADVTRESDCERLVRTVKEANGRIDVLHNNVGIGTGDAGPTQLTEEVWDRIMAVNVKGLALTCKHVVPVMREQMGGSIVNISSIAAVCSVGIVAYKTSKAAVNAFSHALALGNARYGIRVNVIMPGLIDTPDGHRGHLARPRHSQGRASKGARRPGAAPRKDGHGVGRRPRRPLPRLRRGPLHHRCRPPG